jgi:hypothetical protein
LDIADKCKSELIQMSTKFKKTPLKNKIVNTTADLDVKINANKIKLYSGLYALVSLEYLL